MFSKVVKVATATFFGYEIGKDMVKKPKVEIESKIVRVVTIAVKDANNNAINNKDSSDLYQLALCLILAAIFLAIIIGITVFSCYKKQSSTAKKAVESYIVSLATK